MGKLRYEFCRSEFTRLPYKFKSNGKTYKLNSSSRDPNNAYISAFVTLASICLRQYNSVKHKYKWHDDTFWILCWYSTAFLLSSSLVCLESLSSASYRSLRRRAADRSSSSCLMVTCISSSCAWYSWHKGHQSWWVDKHKLCIHKLAGFSGYETYFRNVSMYSGCSAQNRQIVNKTLHLQQRKSSWCENISEHCNNLPRNITTLGYTAFWHKTRTYFYCLSWQLKVCTSRRLYNERKSIFNLKKW